MKTLTTIALLCVISFSAISCKRTISKEEATKQISTSLNKEVITYHMQTYFILNDFSNLGSNFPARLANAKREDYLDYETRNITNSGGTVDVTMLITLKDKINQFVIKKEANFDRYLGINYFYLVFKGGTFDAKITSMTEPGQDAFGRFVCAVTYTKTFIPTDIFRILADSKKEETKEAVFVKMQDGWQLVEDK